MTNEDTNNTQQAGEEVTTTNTKPLSLVEEARAIRDEITKAKAELQEEREKLEQVKSEQILSGDNGGHVEAKPAPEVTPEDYAKAAMEGKIGDGKEQN